MAAYPVSRIFVVDDERLIAKTLSIILQQKGFEAQPFDNPREALEAAKARPPDLLISDVVMPDLSGVDLAIELQAIYPDCAVLLFSGQAAMTDLLEDARGMGHSFTLLSKPIDPVDLLRAIRDVLTEKSVGRRRGHRNPGARRSGEIPD